MIAHSHIYIPLAFALIGALLGGSAAITGLAVTTVAFYSAFVGLLVGVIWYRGHR